METRRKNHKNRLIECECGCHKTFPVHRMSYCRATWHQGGQSRPGAHAYLVSRECREPFERELIQRHALEATVTAAAGHGILHRLQSTLEVHDLTVAIHRRNLGQARADRLAWGRVLVFVLPWFQRFPKLYSMDTQAKA